MIVDFAMNMLQKHEYEVGNSRELLNAALETSDGSRECGMVRRDVSDARIQSS